MFAPPSLVRCRFPENFPGAGRCFFAGLGSDRPHVSAGCSAVQKLGVMPRLVSKSLSRCRPSPSPTVNMCNTSLA